MDQIVHKYVIIEIKSILNYSLLMVSRWKSPSAIQTQKFLKGCGQTKNTLACNMKHEISWQFSKAVTMTAADNLLESNCRGGLDSLTDEWTLINVTANPVSENKHYYFHEELNMLYTLHCVFQSVCRIQVPDFVVVLINVCDKTPEIQ